MIGTSNSSHYTSGLFQPRRRCDRCSVINAEPAEARQLQCGMTQIQTCHEAEEIELDALDPANLHPEQPPQRSFYASATVGQPKIGAVAEILSERIGRQRGLKLRDRAQDGRGERIAVRSGPDAIVTEIAVSVGFDG